MPGSHTEPRTCSQSSEVGVCLPPPIPSAGPGEGCVKRHAPWCFQPTQMIQSCVLCPQTKGKGWIPESSLELSPAANRVGEPHFPVGGVITWRPLFPQAITSYVHPTLGGEPCVCGGVCKWSTVLLQDIRAHDGCQDAPGFFFCVPAWGALGSPPRSAAGSHLS